MINPVQTSIPQRDGSDRYVIIEPILEKAGDKVIRETVNFKIYKDVFGDKTQLFTKPKGNNGSAGGLPDEQNPDYLGKFIFKDGHVQHFGGMVLSVAEQAYLAVFIESYPEPDI